MWCTEIRFNYRTSQGCPMFVRNMLIITGLAWFWNRALQKKKFPQPHICARRLWFTYSQSICCSFIRFFYRQTMGEHYVFLLLLVVRVIISAKFLKIVLWLIILALSTTKFRSSRDQLREDNKKIIIICSAQQNRHYLLRMRKVIMSALLQLFVICAKVVAISYYCFLSCNIIKYNVCKARFFLCSYCSSRHGILVQSKNNCAQRILFLFLWILILLPFDIVCQLTILFSSFLSLSLL